jgi:hypothetical protein
MKITLHIKNYLRIIPSTSHLKHEIYESIITEL